MKLTAANCRVEKEATDSRGPARNGASVGSLRRKVAKILQREGCVWPMQDGRACGEPVEWTCGVTLDKPRLYCDPHGSYMNQRMLKMGKKSRAAARKKAKGNSI